MKKIFPVLIIALIFLLDSCQDVIQLDLNSTAPKYVIEGIVSNAAAAPYSIKITQTTDYFNPVTPPSVSGALVTIADDAGNRDTLIERSAGVYITQNLKGTIGRTYTLRVKIGSNEFTAASKMPVRVALDSVSLTKQTGPFAVKDTVKYQMRVHFNDPAGIGNNYRARLTKNGSLAEAIYVQSDSRFVADGTTATFPLFGNDLKSGDSATIELWTMDNGMYDFFSSLSELTTRRGGGTAAPGNPTTNIKGGALGYFGAVSISAKSLTVK